VNKLPFGAKGEIWLYWAKRKRQRKICQVRIKEMSESKPYDEVSRKLNTLSKPRILAVSGISTEVTWKAVYTATDIEEALPLFRLIYGTWECLETFIVSGLRTKL